jgi:hypothetical protein
VGEPWGVCITLDFLVKNTRLPLWLLERQGGERDSSFSGHLNNEDVRKP